MKLLSKIFILILLFAFSSHSYSEEKRIFISHHDALGLMKFAKLEVSDQVKGKCWTNSDTIESNIKLKLERNGIETINYDPIVYKLSSPIIRFIALGYKAGPVCIASLSVSVEFQNFTTLGDRTTYFANSVIYRKNSIVSGSNKMNEQIRDQFDGWMADILATHIAKSRNPEFDRLFIEFPALATKPPKGN